MTVRGGGGCGERELGRSDLISLQQTSVLPQVPLRDEGAALGGGGGGEILPDFTVACMAQRATTGVGGPGNLT